MTTVAIKAAMRDYYENRIVSGKVSSKVSTRLWNLLTPETANTSYVYQTSEGMMCDRPLELAIYAADILFAMRLVREIGATTLTYGGVFQLMNHFFDPTSSEEDKCSVLTIIVATLQSLTLIQIKMVIANYSADRVDEGGAPLNEEQIADFLYPIAMNRVEASRGSAWARRRHLIARWGST